MKRSVFFFIFVSIVMLSLMQQPVVEAQINEEELEDYLSTIHWTKGELEDYLQFYDYSIEEFETLQQIQQFLGTPINNDNLYELLGQFQMQHSDLEELLAEYGETLDEYKFIEDLALDVQFYLSKHDNFIVANDFLSLFGLTEAEMQKFFQHVSEIDDKTIEAKLHEIRTAIDAENHLLGRENLMDEEQAWVLEMWSELLSRLKLDAQFYLVQDESMRQVELHEISSMDGLDGSALLMLLYDFEGELIASLLFSEEMLTSHLMYESLELIGEVSLMAKDYRYTLYAAKLPQTAGHYVTKIMMSIFLLVTGLMVLRFSKRRVN